MDLVPMSNRLRFAPSPTGELHVGNARTAIFNWLFVRKYGGSFIVRIEDTDINRSQKRFENQIFNDLKWLGLDWQEGPDIDGQLGPYRQSDRTENYKVQSQKLLDKGLAYKCFCTEKELFNQAEEAKRSGLAWKYPGTCRTLSREIIRDKIAKGCPSVVRLKVRPGRVQFQDIVHGKMDFTSEVIGDPILIRSTGFPTYNFAVVVDDFFMKITHVVRGDDHLSNTPRQVLIYEAFGWKPPVFAHLSTILGEDRTRLSKRHGSTSIQHFREKGILPEALLNYLTLLGWAPREDQGEILEKEQLIESFDLGQVSKSSAVFDFDKLHFFNRHYMKTVKFSQVIDLALSFFLQEGFLEEMDTKLKTWFELVVQAFLPGTDHLSQITNKTKSLWFYDGKVSVNTEGVHQILTNSGAAEVIFELNVQISDPKRDLIKDWPVILEKIKSVSGQKGKNLFHPIRVALTGVNSGPELEKVISILELGSSLNLPRPVKDCRTRVSEFIEAMTLVGITLSSSDL